VSLVNDRDNPLWLQMWRDRRTADFHQHTTNPLLTHWWPTLVQRSDSRVFVPLCGKSLDMLWLARQGHEVIGVELSPVAVKAFFKENRLRPVKRRQGTFTLWQSGRITILCGDFFALTAADLGRIDTVYDRAALTALPEDVRRPYVEQLRRVIPDSAQVLLLTIEDAEPGTTAAQDGQVDAEITALYTADFHIDLAHTESRLEVDPQAPHQAPRRAEYKVYRLSGSPAEG